MNVNSDYLLELGQLENVCYEMFKQCVCKRKVCYGIVLIRERCHRFTVLIELWCHSFADKWCTVIFNYLCNRNYEQCMTEYGFLSLAKFFSTFQVHVNIHWYT